MIFPATIQQALKEGGAINLEQEDPDSKEEQNDLLGPRSEIEIDQNPVWYVEENAEDRVFVLIRKISNAEPAFEVKEDGSVLEVQMSCNPIDENTLADLASRMHRSKEAVRKLFPVQERVTRIRFAQRIHGKEETLYGSDHSHPVWLLAFKYLPEIEKPRKVLKENPVQIQPEKV